MKQPAFTPPGKPIHSSSDEARQSIKPWSNRGLAKAGVSRKQAVGINFHVNEDWIEIQDRSSFWLNLNFSLEYFHGENDLRLRRSLNVIEKQISGSLDRVKNLIRFFGIAPRSK